MDSAAYSGAIWARAAMVAHRALATLHPDRVLTVRYEDFVRHPSRVVRETAAFCGALWREDHDALIPHLEDRNSRWREWMTPEEQVRMIEQARPGLRYFGYDRTVPVMGGIEPGRRGRGTTRSDQAP